MRRAMRISDDGVTIGRLRPKRLPWTAVVDIVVLRHPGGRRTVAVVGIDGIAFDLGHRREPDRLVAEARGQRRAPVIDPVAELGGSAPPPRLEVLASPWPMAVNLAFAGVFVTMFASFALREVLSGPSIWTLTFVVLPLFLVGALLLVCRNLRDRTVWADVDGFVAGRGTRQQKWPMACIDRFARLGPPGREHLVVMPADSGEAFVVVLPPDVIRKRRAELVTRLERLRAWRSAHPGDEIDGQFSDPVDDVFRAPATPNGRVQRAVLVPVLGIACGLFVATMIGTWISRRHMEAVEARGRPVSGRVVAVDTTTSSPSRQGLVTYDADRVRTTELVISDAESTGEVTIELEYDPDRPDVVWRPGQHPWADQWWATAAMFLVVVPLGLGLGLWLRWNPLPPDRPSDRTRPQSAAT